MIFDYFRCDAIFRRFEGFRSCYAILGRFVAIISSLKCFYNGGIVRDQGLGSQKNDKKCQIV